MASIQDTNRQKFLEALGIKESTLSNSDLERLVLLDETAVAAPGVGKTNTDLRFLSKHGFSPSYVFPDFDTPKFVPGLAAYYRADRVFGVTLAKDSFTRATNLLTNPGFEAWGAGAVPDNWVANDGQTSQIAQIVKETTEKYLGAHAVKIDGGLAATTQQVIQQNKDSSTNMSLVDGRVYTYSIYVKGTLANPVQVYSVENKGAYPQIALESGTFGWKRVSLTFTASTAATGNYRFFTGINRNLAAGEVLYLDGGQLEEGSVATQYSSSMELGVSDLGHVWRAQREHVLESHFSSVNGRVRAANANQAVASIDVGVKDVEFSFTLLSTTFDPGFTVRGDSSGNYIVANNSGNLFTYDVSTNAFTNFAGLGIRLDTVGKYTVKIVDNTLTVTDPNGSVVSATHASLAGTGSASYFGLRSHTSVTEWDDFEIRTPIQADGSVVATWPDLSGNKRHAIQATAAKRPLYRTQGRNLATYNDASLETTIGTWGNHVNAAIVRSTDTVTGSASRWPAHGLASAKVTPVAVGNFSVRTSGGAFNGTTTRGYPVEGGKTYTFTLDVRGIWGGGTARTVSMHTPMYTNDGTVSLADGSTGSVASITANHATNYSIVHTVTAPADAQRVYIYAQVASSDGTDVAYFDKFGMFEGTVTEWTPPVQTPNGRAVVQFDGVDDFLAVASTGIDPAQGVYTAYVITLPDTITVGRLLSTADGHNWLLGTWGNEKSSMYNGENFVGSNIAGDAAGLGVASLNVGRWDGTDTRHYRNGTHLGTLAITTLANVKSPGTLQIGAWNGSSEAGRGSVACVLIYDTAHDDATRKKIEKWLGNRFGITVAS